MKRVIFLLFLMMILVACNPTNQPTAEVTPSVSPLVHASPTPTMTDTQAPVNTPTPTPTPAPTKTAATASPIFDLYIDNLAISPGGQVFANGFNQGDSLRHFARWEGTHWSELGRGFSTAGNSLAVDSLGNLYTEIITGTVSCMAIMQWDGSAWEDITGNFASVVDALQAGRLSCNVPVMALAVDGEDTLYAAGTYYYPNADFSQEIPMSYVAAWKDGAWSIMGSGFEGVNIHTLAVNLEGNVYIAGEQPATPESGKPINSFVAHWDGKKWSEIGASLPDVCLSANQLAKEAAGGVFAKCTLDGPGELVSRWDGTGWTTISDRLEGEAPSIYVMAADENGQLFIGGDFDSVNGVQAKDIAYWDGSAWHALGVGVNERVQALALDPDGMLYAGGWFSQAGGKPVDHIAIWDGEAWQVIGR